MKKLYVGNLSFEFTDDNLRQMFQPHGTVESAKVATDRHSGMSRGFGFIEMATNDEAKAAIAALNGSELGGRALVVNEAKPKLSGFESGRNGQRGRFGKGGGHRW